MMARYLKFLFGTFIDIMLSSATTTAPSDWSYVSEGGDTIVFSFTGNAAIHSNFQGKVLRLPKASRIHSISTKQNVPDENESTLLFHQAIIERLIPLINLPQISAVHVDRTWLDAMADYHETYRPSARTTKDGIDVTRTRALIATDVVGRSGLSVEIKVSS